MDTVQLFLKSKYYGAPYLPSNFPELLFYIRIQFWSFRKWAIDELKTRYTTHEVWGYIDLIRDLVFFYVVYVYVSRAYSFVAGHGIVKSGQLGVQACLRKFFTLFLSLPPIKAKVKKELDNTTGVIEHALMLNSDTLLQFPALPEAGVSNSAVLEELDKLQELKHSAWDKGRVSGAVYHGGDELLELQSEAYAKYLIANQLHPDVFPGVRKMESEVVSMVLNLFNAPETGCGTTTSGGTESLLLTGLAAREYGRRYKGIKNPEVIAPITVHAGIEKACYYFGMKLHKVDLDPKTYQVDLAKCKKLINGNTVLLVGSAPNYPHGIIDNIEGLSKLAVKYKIPLHVDACLGSFIVAFLEKAKIHKTVPLFDFRLPGVTSISCDTHKYGFAPKGSSIIMYRHNELRKCQYYISSDWTGGMYGSPTLAGSRPGALMVGCWATLVNIGEEGYTQYCKEIVGASMKLKEAIQTNPVLARNIEVIGDPIGTVIAFKAKHSLFSIYALGDSLTKKGWHFATLQSPAALHFALTKLTVPIIDELVESLIASAEEVEKSEGTEKSDTAAIYGVAGSVSTVGVADRVIEAFLDTLYKV